MSEQLTKEKCPCCGDYHPAEEGITVVRREFECTECGESWEDEWCCDCDDECPNCGTDMTSLEVISEDVIEEPVYAAD